jgi:hypothetical protein
MQRYLLKGQKDPANSRPTPAVILARLWARISVFVFLPATTPNLSRPKAA